jgi:hypothetical protein
MTAMNSRTGNLVGAVLLLAFFAWLGVRSSLAAAGADLSGGARVVTLLQWWYAVLAALAIIGLLLRQAGTRLVLFAWAAIFTTRNALTPVFLGGKGVGLAIAGGAIGLAISVGVLYLAFRALDAPGETPTT